MNQRKHLTLVAAAASLLAVLPLSTVFETYNWLVNAFLMVAVLCGVALIVRSLRVPSWAPPVAMGGAALLALTWLFPSGKEFAAVLPSPASFQHFGGLLNVAATEMREFAAPVGDRAGFLFLATVGVAAVAIVIDLAAVVLRRPALAGLPMLAIYSVPVAVNDTSVHFFPFVLGAVGFLWLLVTDNVDRVRRFGRRFTGDGRDVDLWEPSPLAAAGQRLGAIGVVAAVALPLLVPGMTGGLLERFGSGTGPGVTGGTGGRSVSLFAQLDGELTRDRSIEMLKVTNVNDPNPFYLRLAVAEELTASGFRQRPISPGQPVNSGIPAPGYPPGVTPKAFKANVEVLALKMAYLPIYTYPTKVEKLDNNWVFDRNTTTIYSSDRRQTTDKRKYTVEYLDPQFTLEQLKNAAPLRSDDPVVRTYTTAPANTIVKDKVAELTTGKVTQYDKVRAIFDFFSTSNGFVYDVTTGAETSGSKIADFLQNKRGYCVQYAAAMGWLLREAKIPSRVAFGFTRGTPKQGSNTVTLTNFNLHAWTEVYFPGFGWVPFDPTPATAVGGSVNRPYAPNPSQPDEAADPGADPVNRGGAGGPEASTGPTEAAPAPVNPGPGASDTPAERIEVPIFTILGILAVLLLLAAPGLSRLASRRRRLRFRAGQFDGAGAAPGEAVVLAEHDRVYVAARTDAHQAWDELLDTMVDFRVPVDDAETPRVTGTRLVTEERLGTEAETAIKLLSTAEEHARYAQRPLTGRELRTSLNVVRKEFAGHATFRTRLLATVLPPSVMLRWRTDIWRVFTNVVNAVGRRRDRVVRMLSVRRLVTRRAR